MLIYTGALIAVLMFMHFVSIFAIKKKRNDMADAAWGPGFLIAAFAATVTRYQMTGMLEFGAREILILLCVTVWAIRLFTHIAPRMSEKKEEDVRYKNQREKWGKNWMIRSYFQVFILQAVLLFMIALSVVHAIETAPQPFTVLTALGALVWLVGFSFEAISDYQLEEFRSVPENKGKIMDKGLWAWSRHPNYFGEVVLWWGIFLMAFNVDALYVILSPLTITILILKVSGVPLLEKLCEDRPGYAEYKRKTSVFFPRPPKKAD